MLEVIALLFFRTIQFDAKDAFGAFGNDLVHRLLLLCLPMSSELGLDAARLPGDIDCSVVIAANGTRYVARGPTPSPRRQISCLGRAFASLFQGSVRGPFFPFWSA